MISRFERAGIEIATQDELKIAFDGNLLDSQVERADQLVERAPIGDFMLVAVDGNRHGHFALPPLPVWVSGMLGRSMRDSNCRMALDRFGASVSCR